MARYAGDLPFRSQLSNNSGRPVDNAFVAKTARLSARKYCAARLIGIVGDGDVAPALSCADRGKGLSHG